MVGMRKRSILTALVTASLAVSLAACGETDTAHSYTTPKVTKTVEKTLETVNGAGISVPEKRDLKVKLPNGQSAVKWQVDVSDPSFAEVGKSENDVVTIHPLKPLGEDDAPVTVTLTSPDGAATSFTLKITEGAN